LIVDDNATNRHLLMEMLKRWSMNPVAVSGGRQAIQAVRERAVGGNPFQVVLLDSQMPGMDGFETAVQLKNETAQSESGSGIPIIILTSVGTAGEGARCRTAGIRMHLHKPVSPAELMQAICSVLIGPVSTRVHPAPAEGIASSDNRKILKVLLAEDNPVNRIVALRLVEKQGHLVECAGNGLEVLELLSRQTFDLILMDLEMPEMDGFETTRRIREAEREVGRHMPILAMTAHAMIGDEERCLVAGMDGYLSKPIDVKELFRILDDVPQGAIAAGELSAT
jgi:CheY-like chemotaxis protein